MKKSELKSVWLMNFLPLQQRPHLTASRRKKSQIYSPKNCRSIFLHCIVFVFWLSLGSYSRYLSGRGKYILTVIAASEWSKARLLLSLQWVLLQIMCKEMLFIFALHIVPYTAREVAWAKTGRQKEGKANFMLFKWKTEIAECAAYMDTAACSTR